MHKEVLDMEDALEKYYRGILPDYQVFKIVGNAIKEMKNAVLDLQLKQCSTCSWKMIHDTTFKSMNIEDLCFVQSELNKELIKRIRRE